MSSFSELDWACGQLASLVGKVKSMEHDAASGHMHLGSVTRLTVEFENEAEKRTFILKKNATIPAVNRFAKSLRLYAREVQFYSDIAAHIHAPIPHCYRAELLEDGEAFLLLLEDLRPLEVGDTHSPMTVPQANAAARTLGRFHGSLWGQSTVLSSLNLMKPGDSLEFMKRSAQPSIVDRFVATWKEELNEKVILRLGGLCDRLDHWVAALEDASGLHTIIHGDAKPTNLMFSEPTTVEGSAEKRVQRCVLLDFQSFVQGGLQACADDLNYLLVGGLAEEDFALHREALVHEYVQAFNSVAGENTIAAETVLPLLAAASEGLLVRMLMFYMMMMNMPVEAMKAQLVTFIRRAVAAVNLH